MKFIITKLLKRKNPFNHSNPSVVCVVGGAVCEYFRTDINSKDKEVEDYDLQTESDMELIHELLSDEIIGNKHKIYELPGYEQETEYNCMKIINLCSMPFIAVHYGTL